MFCRGEGYGDFGRGIGYWDRRNGVGGDGWCGRGWGYDGVDVSWQGAEAVLEPEVQHAGVPGLVEGRFGEGGFCGRAGGPDFAAIG